ncbi:MAG TPA: cupin domain-containing protein [Rhizomicrobium sp.]|nr:cupin domain-containing protein [Rhizomicrobium sp.]
MILSQAQRVVQAMLAPMPLDTFLNDILGKRFIKLEGANNPARLNLMGDDPEAAILDAFDRLSAKITSHAAEPIGAPPQTPPLPDAASFRQKIDEFHERRYTVRVPEIRSVAPRLDEFIRALEVVLQVPAEAEVFWSRNDGKAPIHHDDYDIVVIQISGRKRWFISTDPSPLPNEWRLIPDGPPRLNHYEQIDVEVGDMLYLPRGTTHRVEGIADSLHASIGFTPITLREMIIACLDHVSDFSKPLRENAGATAAQVFSSNLGNLPARVQDGLAFVLAQIQKDGVVADAMQRRSSRFVSALPSLKKPTGDVTLSPATRMRHAPLATSHLYGNATTLDFAYPGGHHYIHRGAEQSVVFIARTPEFSIRDIPGEITNDVRIALVKKFLESGFLEVAGDER